MDMSSKASSEHFLTQVDRLIDWTRLAPMIQAISARVHADVPPAAVKMMLLARWYGMSEAALLEACQDRISFRRFLELPPTDDADDVRLAEAFRRSVAQAAMEAQNLTHAIEAQLLAKGFSIKPGIWSEAAVVPTSSSAVPDNAMVYETTFFQPGEIADLLRERESVLVRGGAKVSTSPSYSTASAELTPPPLRESAPLQFAIALPWGVTIELTDRLNIGRESGFCPLASELAPYTHVSRRHAELMACPEGVWVRDLRSRNGTFVNDEELPKGQAHLVDTDAYIRFGPYCLVQLKLKTR
jgi:hypothetical protein